MWILDNSAKRKEAEETLTLLAATNSVNEDLNLRLVAALTNLKEEKSISLIKSKQSPFRIIKVYITQHDLHKNNI